MFRRRRPLFFAEYTTLLLLLVFLSASCDAEKTKPCDHNHSTCGNIDNIAYPFRLKGEPENCGHKNYELSCEDNRTVLHLYSGKYYVQAINYENHTIRLVDVGIQKDNCSSLPLYSLTWYNFTHHGQSPYRLLGFLDNDGSPDTSVVAFLGCEKAVKSPLYIDTSGSGSSCVKEGNSSVKGNFFSYVMVGNVHVSDVPDSCRLERVVMATPPLLAASSEFGVYSLLEVHNAMAYGFELVWDSEVFFCSPTGWSSFTCVYSLEPKGLLRFLSITIGVITVFVATRIACMPCAFGFLIYKFRRRHLSMFDGIEGFLQSQNNLMPIRYSYTDIKKMTQGFGNKLGQGGYGSVYRGKLRSGNLVAVKILSKQKADGQEFINEVATIGRIHHVNVVQLIGFCVEGSKRALVYDFMSNGSLEKYIFSEEGKFAVRCEQMYQISLGVARGIEYLHKGCNMRILHFDIKPHNILLDENFTPKVSDFGLAKLCPADDSIVSLTAARGTMGYMAPELFYKNIGGVSYKADVYSFGMLLMEMAGRRRNWNASDNSSQIYFPSWVYDQLIDGEHVEMGELTEEEREMVKKMMLVALWCIQMKPSDRPSMNKVVEMLEGNIEHLQMPSNPFLYLEDHGIDT